MRPRTQAAAAGIPRRKRRLRRESSLDEGPAAGSALALNQVRRRRDDVAVDGEGPVLAVAVEVVVGHEKLGHVRKPSGPDGPERLTTVRDTRVAASLRYLEFASFTIRICSNGTSPCASCVTVTTARRRPVIAGGRAANQDGGAAETWTCSPCLWARVASPTGRRMAVRGSSMRRGSRLPSSSTTRSPGHRAGLRAARRTRPAADQSRG